MTAASASQLSSRSSALLADIGGTNCRLGIYDPLSSQFTDRFVCSTDDFPSPRDAIAAFLDRTSSPRPSRAALALACPITSDRPRLTNTGWQFDRAELIGAFGLRELVLVNDLVAQARAVASLGPDGFRAIGPSSAAGIATPAAIIGAGTGLGIARIDDLASTILAASEGGHIGFSPSDDVETELVRLWRQHLRRITNEHVVSGPGMVRLYRALGALEDRHVDPIDGPEIVRRALASEDALCVETAERFAKILGSVAGDAALMFCSSSVVLVGTISNTLAPILERGGFRSRFEQRGPGGAFLKSIPTLIAIEPDLGLLGAHELLKSSFVESAGTA